MSHRTFSDDEVGELFRRTAELQKRQEAPGEHGPGLTLDELEGIAAEAGLDPQYLRVAASELERRGRRTAESRVTSHEIVAERWVEGRLDDEVTEGIIAELRHRFDSSSSLGSMGMESYGKSKVQTVGRSVEWQHAHPWTGTQRRVLIQPRDDGVRIRVAQNNPYSGSATGWSPVYAPMFAVMAGILAGTTTASFLLGALVGLIVLIVSWPLMARVGSRVGESLRRDVDELADTIAGHIKPLPLPDRSTLAVPRAASPRDSDPLRPEPRVHVSEPGNDESAQAPASRDRLRGS